MKKMMVLLCLMAGTASGQTYDFDLQMDGNTYQGDFSYTLATDTISNVAVSGGGINFTIDSAPLRGSQWANTYVWFLSTQAQNDTLGFQLVAPLGGAESTFADVYLENNGVQSWCDPGPSACSVMSLTEDMSGTVKGLIKAPEIDASRGATALTLLGCCLLILAGKARRS